MVTPNRSFHLRSSTDFTALVSTGAIFQYNQIASQHTFDTNCCILQLIIHMLLLLYEAIPTFQIPCIIKPDLEPRNLDFSSLDRPIPSC